MSVLHMFFPCRPAGLSKPRIVHRSYPHIALTFACVVLFYFMTIVGLAGCKSTAATNGAGYSFVKFSDPQAARLASQDETAGPAINSNNRQCAADVACRK